MIEGLVVEVKTDDLREHLRVRLAHHTSRAEFYAKQEKEFRENAEDAHIRMGQNTHIQTHNALKESKVRHEKSAQFFKFWVEHIILDETYRFGIDDLRTLEFIDSHSIW